ncbi:MAG: FKBP-type peptidyl-prolyl cis-trans isomerase [Methanoregula sp.]|jgi:peptidylprolyl isomerase|nr:FKBP-type peptidyl-prolyl cis-trans isomerase [Methanoregula sp.]
MKKSEKQKGRERSNAQKRQLQLIIGGAVIALVIITLVGYVFFNPSVAKTGDRVAVYYTGTLDNGTIVKSNMNTTPFVFTIGTDEIIPYGLPSTVIGMQLNETKTVVLSPEDAFGKYDPALIQVVNRSSLPPDADYVVGNDYQIVRKSDNAVAHVKIMNVTPDAVTWDANDNLAGQNLTLKLTLVQIVKQ